MLTYVMIIFLYTTTGSGVATAEFSSMESCSNAAKEVAKHNGGLRSVKTTCVPK